MSRRFLARKYNRDFPPDAFSSSEPAPADTIYLNIGDPDILTPKVILDAAFADAYAGHTKYTDTRGYPELRQEILNFWRNRYGVALQDENICVTASGQFGMFVACQTVIDPGDEVLIIEPYFLPYYAAVEMAGGVPVFVSTRFEEGFAIKPERLEAAVTEKTKALIINNPNNPTGAAYSLETLEAVADFARRHDLLVLADDIYTSFDYTKPFIPIASLPGMFERTVTVNSGSKNFVMTGMRSGSATSWRTRTSSMPQRFMSKPPPIPPRPFHSGPCFMPSGILRSSSRTWPVCSGNGWSMPMSVCRRCRSSKSCRFRGHSISSPVSERAVWTGQLFQPC